MLKEKWKRGEAISYFRGGHKGYDSTKKNGDNIPEDMGNTLYVGSTSLWTDIEDMEVKNHFEVHLKNERAYHAVTDLLTYYDAERTAFSIINRYLRFVDAEEGCYNPVLNCVVKKYNKSHEKTPLPRITLDLYAHASEAGANREMRSLIA